MIVHDDGANLAWPNVLVVRGAEGMAPVAVSLVVRPNDRLPLIYPRINEAGSWKVYDVVIEGVSLVSNFRSQFSRIISESYYAELVRRLKNKVSELLRVGRSSCFSGKKEMASNFADGRIDPRALG